MDNQNSTTRYLKNIQNKVAIVTGGSRGIGLALVQRLLEEGASVAVWSRSAPPIESDRLFFSPTDVGRAEDVTRSFRATKQWATSIDFLINNAGIGTYGPVEEIDTETWAQLFRTNIEGAFLCTRALVPQMKAQRHGHIIQVGSIAGLHATPYLSAYCATKFALKGFSDALMMELRKYSIKVSYIAPGGTDTQFFDQLEGFVPSNRLMKPEEVAQSIVELLNSSANYLPACLELRPLQPK